MRSFRKAQRCVFLVGVLSLASCQDQATTRAERDVVLHEVASVGVLDGPEEVVFGAIRDVRALSDGSFVVLDFQAAEARHFDVDGRFLGTIGGPGQGPEEFGMPYALAVNERDQVGVFDASNGRISLFDYLDDRLEFSGVLRVMSGSAYAARERNICGLEDHWFVQTLHDDLTIHRYDVGTGYVESFQAAQPFSEDGFEAFIFVVYPSINSGMLLCSENPRMLLSVGLRTQLVRAYSPDGRIVWEHIIQGISPERYQMQPNDRVAFGFQTESDGSHVAVSAVKWTRESVLVQYRFWRGERNQPEVTRIDSVELELDSGRELWRTDELPVISDVWGDLVYGFVNEPFPRALILER